MLTLIYQTKYYRFWKSGMLLDFIFKKIVLFNLYQLFYIFNIKLSEKYIIEYNFLKFNTYILQLKTLEQIFNTQAVTYTLSILIFILCIVFFIINIIL